MTGSARFAVFTTRELEQLLIAVVAADVAANSMELITQGEGSVLPRLRAEITQALADRDHDEDA